MATPSPLDVPIPAELALVDEDPPIAPEVVSAAGDALISCGDADTFEERMTEAGSDLWGGVPVETIAAIMRLRLADDGKAEWAMRVLAAARVELVAIREQADAWRTPINEWERDRCVEPSRTVFLFEFLLLGYGLAERQAGGRATVKLPSGKVATRSSGEAVEVDDEAAVIEWADRLYMATPPAEPRNEEAGAAHGAIVKTTRKVLVSELRKHVEIVDAPALDPETGELLADDDGEPVTVRAVHDSTGAPVPGVSIRAEGYTATVTPS